MPWRELTLSSSQTLFTTAQLRWRPLLPDDPNGAQIATLWGDPECGAYGAVVRVPADPNVYTLIRRETSGSEAIYEA